ncbi:MAG: bifunctional transaldolase/phosoglucose isomerase [Anaerolineaceae bacterium]|nr:MAG: bifunctional transaldolase/phosoglucose isomerase [Anaerolineaceae bacterium]
MNPIVKLTSLGQSLWYDNIQRKLLENGELKAMIERGDVRGVTSNPTIFNNAIAKTNDYDSALTPLAWAGWDAEKIFWQLAVEDIQEACELFMPLYEETNGGDGFVSLEVSPYLANDTAATIEQAKALWERVGKPNLMIKIPATLEGIPAVRAVIAAGINVNVTLIFSLERYAEVMIAYLDGLEDRLAAGQPIDHVASVASFFVSRLDTKIDPKLPEGAPLRGKAAVANAKLAYEAFGAVFTTRRWEGLKLKGARVQRPLWASTGTKNPAYSDTLYVDNLIGPETVNTVPPATLDAFRDHGIAENAISRDLDEARSVFAQLKTLGISMDDVTRELEEEGVKSFADAFTQLLAAVDDRRKAAASSLSSLADSVAARLTQLEADSVPARIWSRDLTLWSDTPEGQREASNRLGWLDSPEKARERIPVYQSFAEEIHKDGIDRVLVLGMGGSSLTAEVLSSLQAGANVEAKLSLAILDSTDPAQVKQAAQDFPPDKSFYIVASKSGGTTEMMAAFDHFWKLSNADGSRFIAITDPATDLETLAHERGFRKIFSSDESVGGRYSALTDFGLVPAALLGMDLNLLLDRVDWMKRECGEAKSSARNPGVALGAVLAAAAAEGRDKLTVLADAPLSALAGWIEQIVAESSGKNGKGILPVPLEPLDAPEVYGKDRLFIYLRQTGELDNGVTALQHAGFPVIQLPISNYHDAGAEFFRWEMATAVACHILGVNPFDQPDVQDSKTRTKNKLADFQKTGKLTDVDLVNASDAKPALEKFLKGAKPGDFFTINAYLPRNDETIELLQQMRVAIREKTKCAVTAGFGPRFQHSTGQFHKGGPNKGWFIQVVYDAQGDMEIPTQGLSFGTLLRAQALGDYEALQAAGRKVLRLRLGGNFLRELGELTAMFS